jgi:HD superfamily phosphodiesterase
MTHEQLPPLPFPDLGMPWRVNAPDGSVHSSGYTADQMHAYATAATAALRAELDALRRDAERYRWLRERLLAADFDYNGEGVEALVFELPGNTAVSADCDANIDAAMKETP